MTHANPAGMLPRTLVLGACSCLLAAACAASVPPSGNPGGVTNRASVANRTGVTSLQAPDEGPRSSEPPSDHARDRLIDRRTTEAAEALGARDYPRVLTLTEPSSNAPADPWLEYDRASALAALGRTDAAVAAFQRAELHFVETGDDAGRSVSLWGRALALDEAHRCAEARLAYTAYEDFVRLRDPRGAEMAEAHAASCRSLVVLH
jgi:hypothetical protein